MRNWLRVILRSSGEEEQMNFPAFIIKRLPVRLTYDNNYFNDKYQGIPIGGYTAMIEKLLTGIDVHLGEDYFDNRESFNKSAKNIVFTGMIDAFYDYYYGELEYRNLKFETSVYDTELSKAYDSSIMRNIVPYTRIIEP